MSGSLVWSIISGIAGYILAVLTPTASRVLENFISGIPHFELEEYSLADSKIIVVRARRKFFRSADLGIAVRGNRYGRVAKPKKSGRDWLWKTDLSEARFSQLFHESPKKLEVSFFLGDGASSQPVSISVEEGLLATPAFVEPTDIVVSSNQTLMEAFRSNVNCLIEADEIVLDRSERAIGDSVSWVEVFNGWEVSIDEIAYFSINSSRMSKITSPVTYAYVLTFNLGKKVSLSGLEIGHAPVGDCTGGVVRFYGCEDVLIDSCKLYGCGTVGVDASHSNLLEVVDSDIFECSRSAVSIENCGLILFTRTKIFSNSLYNLIELSHQPMRIIFEDCDFNNNIAEYYFVHSNSYPSDGAIVKFVRCKFEANSFGVFSNISDDFFQFIDCVFDDRNPYPRIH